ncbi:MAG: hypothetical protein JWM57_296 [Phycisphaerales bacterium]|nr:hypothetical protein [Phycisphaerales bacterium]
MSITKFATKVLPVVGVGLFLASTGASTAQAELIYGLTTDNNLFSFDSATPGTILTGSFISGLQANESIVGIDTRPNPAASAGVIFGVGSTGRVYTLNPTNGAATLVGGPITPQLNGTSFDIDFNPTVDRFRIVSDADQNLRVDPNTGAVTNIDGAIAYSVGTPNPNIAGIAYTNNLAGATSTVLYAIDAGNDQLNTMNANVGTLTPVSSLKDSLGNAIDVSGLLGFDVSGGSGVAYVALQQGGNGYSQFSAINLATGGLTNITGSATSGLIGGGLFVRDITVVPEPASLGLAGVAAFGLIARRRRA